MTCNAAPEVETCKRAPGLKRGNSCAPVVDLCATWYAEPIYTGRLQIEIMVACNMAPEICIP